MTLKLLIHIWLTSGCQLISMWAEESMVHMAIVHQLYNYWSIQLVFITCTHDSLLIFLLMLAL